MESQKTRAGDYSHNKGPRDLILKPPRHSGAGRGRRLPIALRAHVPVPACSCKAGSSGLQMPWLKTEVIRCHGPVLCASISTSVNHRSHRRLPVPL